MYWKWVFEQGGWGDCAINLLVDLTSSISLFVYHRCSKLQMYNVKLFSVKARCEVLALSHRWFQTLYLEKSKRSINHQSLILFWAMKTEIIEARFSKWILNPRNVSFKSHKICIESLDHVTGPTSCSKQVLRAGCPGQSPVKFWVSPEWNIPSLFVQLFQCLTAYRMENILLHIRA